MTELPKTLRHLPAAPITPVADLGFRVEGIAFIDALPHRNRRDAREIAERIARAPRPYLATCAALAVPGIRDLRGLLPAAAASAAADESRPAAA